MPVLEHFELDATIVAPCIYRSAPHITTATGVVLEKEVQEELSRFLREYLAYLDADETTYMRLDAFLADDYVSIIEVNVECQEGWGIATNLLRAAGTSLTRNVECCPREIIAYREDYMQEFTLAQQELARLDHTMNIVWYTERPKVRARTHLDSKIHLARFAQTWKGSRVRVPSMYCADNTAWDDIPENVVFKFSEKYGVYATKARYSVGTREHIGHGKFMRKCYGIHEAIAQERITPFTTDDGSVTQAIIMCAGSVPVTGYLQVAPSDEFIINDKTAAKGPLVFI